MNKIQKVSKIIRCYLYAHITVLITAHFLSHVHTLDWMFSFDGGTYLKTAHTVAGSSIDIFILPLWQRLLVSLASAPSILLQGIAALCLARLLKQYEKGTYFTPITSAFFKKIGVFALLAEGAKIIEQLPTSFFLTFMNPPGERTIAIAASNQNLLTLMLGLTIVLVGWVMEHASKLQNEIDHTV